MLFRRIAFSAIVVLLVLGLLNLFGQRPQTAAVEHPAATLELTAPKRVRGGVIYEARFRIAASRELKQATLVLDPGWIEGTTINTVEPSPIGEGSDNGRLVLELGHIPAGQKYVLYMHLQVNPTNVGHRSQDVELRDGDTVLARVDRTITLFP